MAGAQGFPARVSVYRLFDTDGALLYVGVTGVGVWRFREHARAQPWWCDVAHATFEHHPARDEALQREAEVIWMEQPRHNRIQPSRRRRATPPAAPEPAAAPARDPREPYATVVVTPRFLEALIRLRRSDKPLAADALELLDENEDHPSLRLRRLRGELWAVDASENLRMTFVRLPNARKAMVSCSRHYA